MEFTRFRYKLIGLVCIIYMISGCAEIAPPPGGQVDKTRPKISESYPENGSVSVSLDNKVTIHFSERIKKPTVSAVYISPRLQEEPKFNWKSDKVIIEFPESFKPDQTYIISLSEAIRDYRNNTIDTGSIIAFSTGPEIARGTISGKVVDSDNKPLSSILVGLFPDGVFGGNNSIDSIYPDYISQSDRNGIYSFKYIPYGTYTLFGFQDLNKNERFNPANEYYALPESEVTLGPKLFENKSDLVFSKVDTNTIQARSVFVDADKMLRVNLSKPVKVEDVNSSLKSVTITNLEDSLSYRALFLTETGIEQSETFNFYFGYINAGNYRFDFLPESSENTVTVDTITVSESEDKEPPAIKSFLPDDQPLLYSDLNVSVQFSEPIDTASLTTESFAVIKEDSTIVIPELKIENRSLLTFQSEELNQPGRYQFVVSEFDINDLSGNKMGDSLLKYNFQILNPDSMGTVSGTIDTDDSISQSIVLQFKNIRNQKVQEILYNGNSFNLSLMAGEYQLSGFIDSDSDGTRDLGTLFPLTYPERYLIYTDTISVRARFETSDIKFIME